jgi:PAS domain S-box-containing protein
LLRWQEEEMPNRLESSYQNLTKVICALDMVLGVAVILGWIFGKVDLLQILPGYNPMRFNTALCLVISSLGLWLAANAAQAATWRVKVPRALGLFIFMLAVVTLAESAFGWNLHIDQLLWKDVWSPSNPGRMAPTTAVIFTFAGVFLILQGTTRTALNWTAQMAAIAANLTAQWAVLHMIFRIDKLAGAAIHTAFGLFVLSIGMMLAPNPKGLLGPLLSRSAGGRILRNLFFPAIIIPMFVGWVYMGAVRANLVDWTPGAGGMVVLYSAVLLILTIWTANSIDGVDLRLSAIIDSSDDAIYSKAIDGTIVSWNPSAENLFGYAAFEAIGQSTFFLVPPDRHRELEDLLRRVLQGESVKQFETVRVCKDGAQIDVSVTLSPVRNARGEVTAVSAVAQNITARKVAEEKVRIASRYTRSLIEASLDPLVTISPEGKITDVNEATEKVAGISRDRLIGTDFSDYFTEPEKARLGYQAAFAKGAVHDYPLAIRSTSGAVTDVLYNASVFRNEAGEVEGVFAAARDVTERNRIEEARTQAAEALRKLNQELESRVEERTLELRESEQRVRRKLDSILSPEGDLDQFELEDILDLPAVQSLVDGIYKLTHLPFYLLDLKGTPLIAAGWQDICAKFHRVHPEACQNCKESDDSLSTGVEAGTFKIYKCRNNMWDVVTPIILGTRHVGNLFSGQFIFDDEEVDVEVFKTQARRFGFDEERYLAALDRVPRISREQLQNGIAFYGKLAELLTKLDYSAIKLSRAMTETNEINTRLLSSSAELEAFAYSVSHDLRAPLRHMDGFLSLLYKKCYGHLDAQGKHYVDCTLDASKRMGRLIDELLQFSRLGRNQIHRMPVDLHELVEEVQKAFGPETIGRSIRWKVENKLPIVQADQVMLRQVVENLIGNAVKFTRHCEEAEIEIGSLPGSGSEVAIFVRDNGAGFDMQYYNKLYQVFQRLHSEDEFEGTGIGLANVRRVVERHGGRVWAEGKVGEGATFYFALPYGSSVSEDEEESIPTGFVR